MAGPARLLALAAAPTFAAMALLSAIASPPAIICSAAPASPLGAMTVMYLLMALFHVQPWLAKRALRSDARDQFPGR